MATKIMDDNEIKIKLSIDENDKNGCYDDILLFQVNNDSDLTLDKSVSIGLEISNHIGGRILYGYLNVMFEKSSDTGVKVEIPYTNKNKVGYEDSILYNKESCYKGLLKEYVEDLAESIKVYITGTKKFPNCNIKIIESANCEVGSCSMWFEWIIQAILDMFVNNLYTDINKIDSQKIISIMKKNS
ncbi:MAG: hypothetical protein ACI4F4_07300 [Lachnospiraceae bacterium]